jgi:hypothetical protein
MAILTRTLDTACLKSVSVTSDKMSECMHEIIIILAFWHCSQIKY